ncbi:disks large-associated protein 1-like isoform X2 [Corythoichthys intestinalis]|uniref:disks large-associated protein 1-like isoform X2 n=1 Tax=Corythoichthys intestinalis TaxID=161448 RepID=UPI0025A51644|nr:disks large-associated protein 1-like isoform X2 [Corythoichthys intestinalis]
MLCVERRSCEDLTESLKLSSQGKSSRSAIPRSTSSVRPSLPRIMKGLSSSRSHHHAISYEQPYDPLAQHVDRKPYLISQMDMPLPIAVPHPNELSYYNAHRTSYPSDNNNIVPYGTFPRRCHSISSSHHPEVKDECMAMVPYVGGGGGGGYGGKTPTRLQASFSESFEQQPSFSRDGYHTLQYKRGMLAQSGAAGPNANNDSPGRIRHLVHSVQKLFTKSHSLEGPHHTQSVKGANNGSVNGGVGAGPRASPEGHRKRSKSRERCRSAEPKHRSHHHHHHQLHGSASAPGSGYWSSDDNLERELCLYHPHHHQPPPSPAPSVSPSPIAMTMGRYPGNNPDKYPQSQAYFMMDPYGTMGEHAHHGHPHRHPALKVSRSNNDVKYAAPPARVPVSASGNNIGGSGPLLSLGLVDAPLVKKGAWSSSLTVSRAREVYTNNSSHEQLRAGAGSGNLKLDRALIKSKSSQHQERTCHFLQVPQDEWSGFSPLGKEDDIPCRRMRSGSYVKAMAEDDSEDSDGSPKPSPKIQARRASYLKATQPSLTEMTTLQISSEHSPKLQIRSHSYLRALSEVEVNGQIEQVCEQVYSQMQAQAMEAAMNRMERMDRMETMDTLPMPGCFRMRSHSYVRAIDQGCAAEEEGEGGRPLLLLPSSPPRTSATTVRTIQSSTVSSCITTYKKTPPPVPPRTSTCSTASKPYISITAQSSTESAQDAYMEEEGPRGDMTIQSGLSNSTESIDSMKALTAAIEAANAQIHGPASQHVNNSTVTINSPAPPVLSRGLIVEDHHDEYRKEALRKGKCLSIGIQVDGPEETPDPEDPSKFTSVGVQVEDDRRYRRFQRSNSVTTAVQADLDMPGFLDTPLDSSDTDLEALSSGVLSRQYSRDAATSTVSIQGSGNHYHACASDEYEDVGFDPSILPPPDPWIDSISEDLPDVGYNSSAILDAVQRSVCQRDGRWFLKLLQAESDRMEGWCRQMEMDQQHNNLPEDVLGKIRSAIGSAQLLMSQKFQQFRELCEENLNPHAHPRPVASDLAGFWDMLQLSIENISLKFDELHQLRANNWRPLDPPERKERRLPPPVPKKPPKAPHQHPPLARDRSLESSEKQRQEARKRLMAAKRAASVRQNSATESADSIEIYIPEAQTRL